VVEIINFHPFSAARTVLDRPTALTPTSISSG
jgi:hypothetical protein